MLSPRATIWCDDGFIGEDRRKFAVVILDIVQSEHVGLRVECDSQSIRGIRACVMQKDIMHAENATFLIERDFCIMDLSALMGSGDKVFSAVFDPFNGTMQFHRC